MTCANKLRKSCGFYEKFTFGIVWRLRDFFVSLHRIISNTIMTKKYELPEDEPCMVSEPAVAYGTDVTRHTKTVSIFENRGNLETAISGEELKRRLHESLMSRFV